MRDYYAGANMASVFKVNVDVYPAILACHVMSSSVMVLSVLMVDTVILGSVSVPLGLMVSFSYPSAPNEYFPTMFSSS